MSKVSATIFGQRFKIVIDGNRWNWYTEFMSKKSVYFLFEASLLYSLRKHNKFVDLYSKIGAFNRAIRNEN